MCSLSLLIPLTCSEARGLPSPPSPPPPPPPPPLLLPPRLPCSRRRISPFFHSRVYLKEAVSAVASMLPESSAPLPPLASSLLPTFSFRQSLVSHRWNTSRTALRQDISCYFASYPSFQDLLLRLNNWRCSNCKSPSSPRAALTWAVLLLLLLLLLLMLLFRCRPSCLSLMETKTRAFFLSYSSGQ